MDYALGLRTALSVCMNVRHNIVAELLLLLSRISKVNIFFCAENVNCISSLAYLVQKGLS